MSSLPWQRCVRPPPSAPAAARPTQAIANSTYLHNLTPLHQYLTLSYDTTIIASSVVLVQQIATELEVSH